MPAEQVFGGKEAMDWMTFIVEMTKASAWPIVVGTGVWYLRRPMLRLFLVAARRLRLVNRASFGGVELAIEAIRPAVVLAETRADEAREKLATDQLLDPGERKRLSEELEAALREVASLRAAQASLTQESDSRTRHFHITGDMITAMDSLHRLVLAMGPERIATMSDAQVASEGGDRLPIATIVSPDRSILRQLNLLQGRYLSPSAVDLIRRMARLITSPASTVSNSSP